MCKNFSRQNNIDQDIIALKKILKWAQNIRICILKNLNQIGSNKADKKYQNEFSNLNELYESNNNFCLSVESESKSNGIKKMTNTIFNLKKTDETKNMPTPILNYAEPIDRATSPTLDVLTCKSDKTKEPEKIREFKSKKQYCLSSVHYETILYEKMKDTFKKELISERKKIDKNLIFG
ncbi:unnamed protein product [Brachionus calyciflorus]|uniref:Uncharacterized protein n=1 Tax=Brachionus calyciflorus TaxID=104777 RepID=A0A813ND73_9BILA|nr:unnamed protein product [Brachionus calyciflorus]